jgi:hypothetical protein
MIGVLRVVVIIFASIGLAAASTPRITIIGPGQTLEGRFQQERHLPGMAAPLQSEGRFLLSPGHGLIWQCEKPFTTTTVITPAGLLQKVDDDALRLPTSRVPFLRHFYDMLSGVLAGNWSATNSDFKAVQEGEAGEWRIRLTPVHAEDSIAAEIESILLTGDSFVNIVEIHKTSGDWERLVFAHQVISSKPLSITDTALFDSVGQ